MKYQKIKELSDKSFLEKTIEDKKTVPEISRELNCDQGSLRYAFRRFGLKPCKKMAKYSDVEFANWRTGKILKTRGAGNLKRALNFDMKDWIHLYPVIRGERYVMGDYCLSENLKNEYLVTGPDKLPIKLKNWLKFAKERGFREDYFKKLLDEEIIYYNGYYLEKNKNIIPSKMERTATIIIDDCPMEVTNVSEVAVKLGVDKKILYNLISGKTTKTSFGAKLKRVDFSRK